MGLKLTPRQQQQVAWLEVLPRRFEHLHKVIELMAVHHADEAQLRSTTRLCDELKAQAGQLGLTALGDAFGYMGMLLRRAGGHQLKVRGLRELLAGAKINFEGSLRAASTPEPDAAEEDDATA